MTAWWRPSPWTLFKLAANPKNWVSPAPRVAAYLVYITDRAGDIVSADVYSLPAMSCAVPPWHKAFDLCVEYAESFAAAEEKVLRRVAEEAEYFVVRKFFPRKGMHARVED